MRSWTRSEFQTFCGGPCGRTVKAGEPVQVIELAMVKRRLVRCEQCADGPVDWEQVHNKQQLREQIAAKVASFTSVRQVAEEFDPKMAAAGRDD